jgi:hypothetical protein
MYELKKKNKDAISSEDEANCIQFFMTWKVDSSKEFCVTSYLIEHDRSCVWDKDKLMQLAKYYKLTNIQDCPIEYTLLIHENTILRARMNATREEECYKFEMTLSETSIKDDTDWPPYFDLDG